MSGEMFKRGDTVIYHDNDHVRWGPWEVLDVLGDKAVVQIEDYISYDIHTSRLKKVVSEAVCF